MALRDTAKAINSTLHLALKLAESDTEVSTIDLDLLINLNTNQSLNYIKLEQDLGQLEKETEKSQALKEEFQLLKDDISHLERQAQALSELTDELDRWSEEVLLTESAGNTAQPS